MQLQEILREAMRNLGTRPWIVAGGCAMVCAVLVFSTAMQAWNALEAEQARRDAGGLVIVAESAGENQIPVTECERLNGFDSIAAAGGIHAVDPPSLSAFPRVGDIPTLAVTSHALEVWDPSMAGVEVVAGSDVAQVHGLVEGTTLFLGEPYLQDTRTIEAVMIDGVPVESLRSRVLFVESRDAQLGTCWVRAEPGLESETEAIVRAVLIDTPVVVMRFHPDPAGTPTPADLWKNYTASLPWLVAAGAMALVILGVLWSRRSEFAVYRAFGTGKVDLAAMVSAEVAFLMIPSAAAGTTLALLAQAGVAGFELTPSVGLVCGRYVLSACAVALAMVPVGAMVLLRGNTLEQLKDR